MTVKKGCTNAIWENTVRHFASLCDIDPAPLLAGDKTSKYVCVRWLAWRNLVERGFSYSSIGKASGYDHTSVIHACKRKYSTRGMKKKNRPFIDSILANTILVPANIISSEDKMRVAWEGQAKLTRVHGAL